MYYFKSLNIFHPVNILKIYYELSLHCEYGLCSALEKILKNKYTYAI